MYPAVQIQDDYLDCFGDPVVIGKAGTDIEDNKCSWLVVQALDHASPEQRSVIEVSGVRILIYNALHAPAHLPYPQQHASSQVPRFFGRLHITVTCIPPPER